MHELMTELSGKFEKLSTSEFVSFSEVAALKNIMGVYMIYNDKKELLYIGNTNNFHVRFSTNLKGEKTHTLVRKLIKNEMFSDRYGVFEYLKNLCCMRIEVCTNKRELQALEHFLAIYILQPPPPSYHPYNSDPPTLHSLPPL